MGAPAGATATQRMSISEGSGRATIRASDTRMRGVVERAAEDRMLEPVHEPQDRIASELAELAELAELVELDSEDRRRRNSLLE
jgi:hypothetical protein